MLISKEMYGIFSIRGSDIKDSTPTGSVLLSNNMIFGKSVFMLMTVCLLLIRNTTVVVLTREMSNNLVLTVVWINQLWLPSEKLYGHLHHVRESLCNIFYELKIIHIMSAGH